VGLRYLLDTDACIYAINRRSDVLLSRLMLAVDDTGMSSISIAELSYGAERSQRVAANMAAVLSFARLVQVVDFDTEAAFHYGQIKAYLAKAGTPIGPYDLLIAGHARALGVTLVTNNRREFDRVPGLSVENWLENP
jgi:tRNA(fMet)-specific endonuclease VapC